MVELPFGRCQHPQTLTYLFPEFSSPKTDVGVPQFQMVRPKISKRSFLDTLWSFALPTFLFRSAQFCAREMARGPKETLFLGWDELGSPGLHRISPKTNITATNPDDLLVRFLISIQKKLYFKIFGRAVPEVRLKSLFSGIKNPGRLHVTCFPFSQRPKVISIILV